MIKYVKESDQHIPQTFSIMTDRDEFPQWYIKWSAESLEIYPFEKFITPYEDALFTYLELDEKKFSELYTSLPTNPVIPNPFFNLSYEGLYQVPVKDPAKMQIEIKVIDGEIRLAGILFEEEILNEFARQFRSYYLQEKGQAEVISVAVELNNNNESYVSTPAQPPTIIIFTIPQASTSTTSSGAPTAVNDNYHVSGIAEGNVLNNDTDPHNLTLSMHSLGETPSTLMYYSNTTTDISITNVNGFLDIIASGDFSFVPSGFFSSQPSGYTATYYYQNMNTNGLFSNIAEINFIAPVILDLNGDGKISLISPELSHVTLGTLTGTHDLTSVGWVSPEEGILAYNPPDQNLSTTDKIAFKMYTPGATTDLQGLIAFDTNHDNKLDFGDKDFNYFGVWQDKNSNGIMEPGEFHTLTQMGIKSISLISDNHSLINSGNIITGFTSYETTNGESHVAADVGLGIGTAQTPGTIALNDVIHSANEATMHTPAVAAVLAETNHLVPSIHIEHHHHALG